MRPSLRTGSVTSVVSLPTVKPGFRFGSCCPAPATVPPFDSTSNARKALAGKAAQEQRAFMETPQITWCTVSLPQRQRHPDPEVVARRVVIKSIALIIAAVGATAVQQVALFGRAVDQCLARE